MLSAILEYKRKLYTFATRVWPINNDDIKIIEGYYFLVTHGDSLRDNMLETEASADDSTEEKRKKHKKHTHNNKKRKHKSKTHSNKQLDIRCLCTNQKLFLVVLLRLSSSKIIVALI